MVNWYFRLRRLLLIFFFLVVIVIPFYALAQSRHNGGYARTVDIKGFLVFLTPAHEVAVILDNFGMGARCFAPCPGQPMAYAPQRRRLTVSGVTIPEWKVVYPYSCVYVSTVYLVQEPKGR